MNNEMIAAMAYSMLWIYERWTYWWRTGQ